MECRGCSTDLGGFETRLAHLAVDLAGDESIFSYWQCATCGFFTVEKYRDSFMGESSTTLDGPLEETVGKQVLAWIARCPDPNRKSCDCETHRAFQAGEQHRLAT